MRRLRFWLLLTITFLRRFAGLLAAGVILGIFLFIVLPRIPVIGQRFTKVERVGLVGRFNQEQLPLFIQEKISIGLTTLDEQGLAKRGLALSWEERDNAKVWVFKLDPQQRWQDGKPLLSQDIDYPFEDVTITHPDEQTLEFHLKNPYSPFPVIVSKPVFKRGLLGAGEYQAAKIVFAGQYVKEILLAPKTAGERLLYRFYPTEEAALTAFKLGEVDQLINIFDIREIENWKNLQAEEVIAEDRYVVLFLNTQNELLSGKSLRQALAYAIDKEKLGGERAISPIPPSSWTYNPLVKPYEFSPGRAQELLEELSAEQRENLTINLVTIPSLLEKAELIANFWQDVGVKTQIQVSNTPPSDFQALLATQAIPPDPDQYSLWHSTQGTTNITGYKDPRVDKLLEDGRTVLDPEERRKIYFDFQRFLVEDSPAIFLYFPATYTITRQ